MANRRAIPFLLVCLVLAVIPARAADQPPSPEAAKQLDQLRTDLEQYYARTYSAPLKQKNRLARLIGVASLAKLDAPSVSDKLIEAAEDADPVVAQVAWEALHARHASLSPAQRDRWLKAGLATRSRGGFPGRTARPLVAAIAGYGYRADGRLLAEMVANVLTDPEPAKLQPVMKQLFLTQPDRQWLRMALSRASRSEATNIAIDTALRTVPDAPPTPAKPSQVQPTWEAFIANLPAPTTQPAAGYDGASEAFAKPERIIDPERGKWRDELELPQLTLGKIDLAYCIDSTGSMGTVNKLLASTLQPLTMALGMCVSDVRAGVVYYRHETDAALQKECCKSAAKDPKSHLISVVPLNKDVRSVVAKMRALRIDPKAGHDKGAGAYAAGLEGALDLGWSEGADVARIVIVIGDAVPTPGSEWYASNIAERLVAKDVRLCFLSLNPQSADAITAIAAAGKAKPVQFGADMMLFTKYLEKGRTIPLDEAAVSVLGTTVLNVARQSVPESYRDRLDPIFRAILPIIQAQLDAANEP